MLEGKNVAAEYSWPYRLPFTVRRSCSPSFGRIKLQQRIRNRLSLHLFPTNHHQGETAVAYRRSEHRTLERFLHTAESSDGELEIVCTEC